MTTQTGLLDTSVVISLPILSVDQLPAFPTISAITLAELSIEQRNLMKPMHWGSWCPDARVGFEVHLREQG
jgi:hypothetical protein